MKNKKGLSLLLVLAIIVSIFTGGGMTKAAMTGDGTEDSPYIIRTVEDFLSIDQKFSKHYQLANDLDFKDVESVLIDSFNGVLDGKGYTLKNVKGENGIFNSVSQAEIRNLNIVNAEMTGSTNSKNYTAILAGSASFSSISNVNIRSSKLSSGNLYSGFLVGGLGFSSIVANCNVINSSAEGNSEYIGGIAGSASNKAIIRNSSVTGGNIKGANYAGGISGFLSSSGTIEQCYSENNVIEAKNAGGIAGANNLSSKIVNCYSIDEVTGTLVAGGIQAHTTTSDNYIINSYAVTKLNGDNTINALTKKSSYTTITSTYFDQDIMGLTEPVENARTTSDMYKKDTFVDWDFDTIWTIDEGKDYPRLRKTVVEQPEQPEVPETPPVSNILKVVLLVGEKLQLSIDDDLSENSTVSWTHSDANVATVDNNGVVTAIAPGNSIVTVTYSDGTKESVRILVLDDIEEVKKYRLAIDLKVGKSCRLTIDDYTFTQPVVWSTMDSTVATITSEGKVTATGKGLTIVTASDNQGNTIEQIYIRVRN